jgi:hypothetical protein
MSRERKLPPEQELAATSCFTGEALQSTFDATNRIVSVQGTGFHRQPLNSIPVLFPYGHLGMPPQGVELTYLETASGLVVVSARDTIPSGIPVPKDGDSIQYSSGGSYSHHDADGDTVHEPKSGQVIKLGAGAAEFTAKGDSVDSRLSELVSELNTFITTAYNLHSHPTAPPGPVSVPSVLGSSATTPASVKATKSKVE